GRAVQDSDIRHYKGRIRQERTAAPGTRRGVLHDVEATVLWTQIRECGPASDVLGSQNGRYVLGRRFPWLPSVRSSILSGADHRVHYFGGQLVGRNGCAE